MTTLNFKMTNPKILSVIESYEDGRRWRWTTTRWEKIGGGYHIDTHCEEVPDVGHLLFIPEGPDVDAVAVRDLTAMAKGKPKKEREVPDITTMYQQFNERRKRELDTKTVHTGAEIDG